MQTTLFGRAEVPEFDASFAAASRHRLDARGGWVERVPGWITGHQALFDELRSVLRWRRMERVMYERVVAVPRLLASLPESGEAPLLRLMADTLGQRYGYRFDAIQLALYRDGADSVAWHRDKGVRDWAHGCVCVASLGGSRTFAVRPLGGGATRAWSTGWGDLVVMGGTSGRHWEHAVPKVKRAEPRMALMFRHGPP
ncbi:MAG: alpha-ketoglutarate-dependent dioxygenase AlkB [Sandaracinaceae bacterium]